MRARLLALLAGVLAVPLLSVPAAVPPTSAAPAARGCANGSPTTVLQERLGDGPAGADIKAVGLWHKPADNCIWATVGGRITGQETQAVQVLFDTAPRRAGAEYYAFAYSPRDGDQRKGAYLVGQVDGQWRYLDCGVQRWFRPVRNQVALGVPKACLGNPRTVRVKVQLWDIGQYLPRNRWFGRADQIPNRRWSPRF
jgi:hypothetical protein